MSGGHFDYQQYRINDIADAIDQLIATNDSNECDRYGDRIGKHYPKHIIDEFKVGATLLRKSLIYAQRIDWLVSGDDGEECFVKRLKEELEGL